MSSNLYRNGQFPLTYNTLALFGVKSHQTYCLLIIIYCCGMIRNVIVALEIMGRTGGPPGQSLDLQDKVLNVKQTNPYETIVTSL